MDKQRQLRTLRTLVQQMGWHDFMMDVGSLMAEQADHVDADSSQSSALFVCSNTVHALRDAWTGCGTFEYPSDMVDE